MWKIKCFRCSVEGMTARCFLCHSMKFAPLTISLPKVNLTKPRKLTVLTLLAHWRVATLTTESITNIQASSVIETGLAYASIHLWILNRRWVNLIIDYLRYNDKVNIPARGYCTGERTLNRKFRYKRQLARSSCHSFVNQQRMRHWELVIRWP